MNAGSQDKQVGTGRGTMTINRQRVSIRRVPRADGTEATFVPWHDAPTKGEVIGSEEGAALLGHPDTHFPFRAMPFVEDLIAEATEPGDPYRMWPPFRKKSFMLRLNRMLHHCSRRFDFQEAFPDLLDISTACAINRGDDPDADFLD